MQYSKSLEAVCKFPWQPRSDSSSHGDTMVLALTQRRVCPGPRRCKCSPPVRRKACYYSDKFPTSIKSEAAHSFKAGSNPPPHTLNHLPHPLTPPTQPSTTPTHHLPHPLNHLPHPLTISHTHSTICPTHSPSAKLAVCCPQTHYKPPTAHAGSR